MRQHEGLALYGAFGLEIKAINCAFKLFRRTVLDGLPIDSMGPSSTLRFSCVPRCGNTIKQVPVSHYARPAGVRPEPPRVVLRAFVSRTVLQAQ